jgi:diaminopimelate epimerase
VNFAKMHGAGNDFLLVDGGAEAPLRDALPRLVSAICDRRLGIGADGVLLVTPVGTERARLGYWNSDGSEAAFCANATRCAARFAAARWGWREMLLETGYAVVPAAVDGERVTLSLPAPEEVGPWRELETAGSALRARYLVVGVPHLVVPVEWPEFWRRDLAPLAPALRRHPALPEGGVNVTFVRVAAGELEARSWERGVEAETLSCGSGDVAAALVAMAEGWLASPVEVRTASRRVLVVEADGAPPACPCRLTGPAEWVADGVLTAEWLASGHGA